MEIDFKKLLTKKEDLTPIDRTNPYNVLAMLVHTLCNYNPTDTNNFYEMLSYLLGEYQPVSSIMKQNIQDRMLQNDKYDFIGYSYFKDTTPENDYKIDNYIISIEEDTKSKEEGYIRLLLKSSGADSKRTVTLRLAKDGIYYIWSDSFMGLLADIRPPESTNPWK